ncbi:Indole-3-glycerol phosphate synthase [Sporotomaculum syntrophicum]|uniref:indole-3-glycerol-phosphate synthase n=1 Tax=Sporotomaculum syntrophicum TaxID=182264 RepID=A0A9D2WPU0_9FIRM|nr:indole-3-glycerol-phosphate synthase [Sporotomaculum syntrophicum]KAF1085144.1 Indole-3-glycerol phosphate synthase [Sporotomaculum syntrophicum]
MACTKCTTALWTRHRLGKIPVIPDIKCKSPEAGDLLRGRDPIALAKSLAAAGAPVLSVVTETEHFGGSPELLRQIAQSTSVPILRKDFITTREQLHESAEIGASGVLLIAAILEIEQLRELIDEAWALGLEPLVETHTEAEIIAGNELMVTFLGINNRNIMEWEMDDGNVNTTEKLAGLVRPGALLLSESSIASPDDVLRATAAGAHAVLVGTAILRAQNPPAFYKVLSEAGR